jgi:hypothetical protein
MVDISKKQELEAQICSSKRELHEVECCEEEILQHIPVEGFRAAAARSCLRARADVLCNSIRKMEQRLKQR